MSNLASEMERPDSRVFRRAYIKRRNLSDGKFETDWQEITKYVKQWGTIESAVDDIKLNTFTQSGVNLTVLNYDGSFNDENNPNSLWSGYLTRQGSLLKIEAGYNSNERFLKTSGLKVAYALKKVVSAYAGNCIKIRRNNSTNTAVDTGADAELDIGFSGTFLNVSAIKDFLTLSAINISSDTAYITIWYDQTTNANNLSQATSSLQPKLNSLCNKITFDGTDDYMVSAATTDITRNFQLYTEAETSDTTFDIIATEQVGNGATAAGWRFGKYTNGHFGLLVKDASTVYKETESAINDATGTFVKVLVQLVSAENLIKIYTNGVLRNSTSVATVGNITSANPIYVGKRDYAPNPQFYHGSLRCLYVSDRTTEIDNFYDDEVVELPANPIQGIFVLDNEIPISAETDTLRIQTSSLKSIFEKVRAEDITGIGATGTASDILTRIKNHTDGSGNFLFQQYITSGAWDIQTTTANYVFPETKDIQDVGSCWKLMTGLAEAESYVLYISRLGNLVFSDREVATDGSQFDFKGLGFPRSTIIDLSESKEALNKTYNYFRFKFKKEDTATSYVAAGTTTTIDPLNISWKYGNRTYEFENTFVPNTATAQGIVDNMLSEFSVVKNEMNIITKMHPDIEILDNVGIYYHSYKSADVALWNVAKWGIDYWAGGYNFEMDGDAYKILSKRLNLDNFSHTFKLREI